MNMWKQPHKCMHLLDVSGVYCFTKNESGYQASELLFAVTFVSVKKT